MTEEPRGHDSADHVTLSVRLDETVQNALEQPSYRAYLRRTRAGPLEIGDEFEEFVSCGCGSTRDVRLRVESIDGGRAIGADTAFSFVPRVDGD